MHTRSEIIQILKNDSIYAETCFVVESFLERTIGLIGRGRLNQGEGLHFPRCKSIHTLMMRIPIDVVFIRKNEANRHVVTSVHRNVRPWKVLPLTDWNATDTIELPSGSIERLALEPGDELCIS